MSATLIHNNAGESEIMDKPSGSLLGKKKSVLTSRKKSVLLDKCRIKRANFFFFLKRRDSFLSKRLKNFFFFENLKFLLQ